MLTVKDYQSSSNRFHEQHFEDDYRNARVKVGCTREEELSIIRTKKVVVQRKRGDDSMPTDSVHDEQFGRNNGTLRKTTAGGV